MRQGALLCAALLAIAGCGRSTSNASPDAGAVSSATAPAGSAAGPCGEADALRAKASALASEGRLDRAVRTIDQADGKCAAGKARSAGQLVAWLADLGEADRVRTVAGEINANATASPADKDAAQKALKTVEEAAKAEPLGLVRAGREALDKGDKAGAQRLFDKALSAARRSKGPLVLEEQHALMGATRAAWSRDGTLIALSHGDTLSILDGQTFTERVAMPRGHTQKINAIALSPDGTTVASAAADGTIRLWNTETGKFVRKLEANWNTVHAVAFSPDGRLLASDTNHMVRLWDQASGRVQETLKGGLDGVNTIAFRPDGNTVAAGSYDNRIGLWDARGGAILRRLYKEGLPGSSIAFSPDGKLLAANTARKILLWDVDTGNVSKELGDKEWADFLTWHPGGKLLAAASTGASSDKLVRLWDVEAGTVVKKLEGHTAEPTAIVFNPDGTLVAAGSEDRSLLVWDTSSGRVVHTIKRDARKIGAAAISADGRRLSVVAGDDRLMTWDLTDGKLTWQGAGKATSLSYRADGSLVAADGRDRMIRLVDGSGKVSAEIPGAAPAGAGVFAWSADRKRAAVASSDASIAIVELDGGKVVTTLKDTDRAHAIAFSPDGQLVAVGPGYKDKAVRVWDVATGRAMHKLPGHKDRGNAIAFSPDGSMLASGAEDHTVQVWTKWGNPRSLGHGTASVSSLEFSSDGKMLATGADDGLVRLWDLSAKAGVRELAGNEAAVRWVGFASEGKLVASSGDDGTVRFWSVSDGSHLATIRVVGSDSWYAFARGRESAPGSVMIGGADAAAASQFPACRFGALVLPFEVCRDRVTSEGFLGAALRGEAFEGKL